MFLYIIPQGCKSWFSNAPRESSRSLSKLKLILAPCVINSRTCIVWYQFSQVANTPAQGVRIDFRLRKLPELIYAHAQYARIDFSLPKPCEFTLARASCENWFRLAQATSMLFSKYQFLQHAQTEINSRSLRNNSRSVGKPEINFRMFAVRNQLSQRELISVAQACENWLRSVRIIFSLHKLQEFVPWDQFSQTVLMQSCENSYKTVSCAPHHHSPLFCG